MGKGTSKIRNVGNIIFIYTKSLQYTEFSQKPSSLKIMFTFIYSFGCKNVITCHDFNNWIKNQGHHKIYFHHKKYMKRRRFNKDHFEDVNPVKIHGKRLLAKLSEIYHTYLSRLMASMNSDS